ncbi:MAG: chemotaxis protein CheD [Deltaproteobacteria bacterium]|nr:chemotaxis protein CheD [Deltaproteobacteria bacterium]
MQVSKELESTLITYSLGSCLAVCLYDSTARVGGMLHLMLPDSKIDPGKAKVNPFMFADTGIPVLFKACYKLGATKAGLKVRLAGASQAMDESGIFKIGKRNYQAARRLLWKNNVNVAAEDVGGTAHRTVWLEIATGDITMRFPGRLEKPL